MGNCTAPPCGHTQKQLSLQTPVSATDATARVLEKSNTKKKYIKK